MPISPLSIAQLTVEQIQARLEQGTVHDSAESRISTGGLKASFRQAAVLIPLLWLENEWHILFTRRTDSVQDHKGQVAFPGGSSEPGDADLAFTALREAYEEIGLQPDHVRLIGRLDSLLTGSGYLIAPFVGVIPWPYSLSPAPLEVAHVFTISLAWLADPAHREERPYVRASGREPEMVIFFEPYQGETLWGISARITVDFLQVLSAE